MRLLEWNSFRTQIQVVFLPTSQVAGNTGRVHIGVGHFPNTTVGDPNQGTPMAAGDVLTFVESYVGDPSVPKDVLWALATIAGQVLDVLEDSYNPEAPPRAVPVRVIAGGP